MTFRPFLRLRFPRVFGRFGLGFRWCLAFSHPLPTKSIYVFVQARLRGPNLFWDMSFEGLADLQCWTLFFLFLFVGSVGDVSAFFAPTVSSRFWSFWARI